MRIASAIRNDYVVDMGKEQLEHDERSYVEGRAMALREVMRHCARELGIWHSEDPLISLAHVQDELARVRTQIRELAEDVGCEWDESLDLADFVEKRLARVIAQKQEEREQMSFTRVHNAETTIGDEKYALVVYADQSAVFAIVAAGSLQSERSLGPDEDGSDVAISGEARAWFDKELAAGRSKAKDGES
jgi:hypothetical protein